MAQGDVPLSSQKALQLFDNCSFTSPGIQKSPHNTGPCLNLKHSYKIPNNTQPIYFPRSSFWLLILYPDPVPPFLSQLVTASLFSISESALFHYIQLVVLFFRFHI